MFDALTAENITLSAITLVSLLVNAVTIYHWVRESRTRGRTNDQAFHMVYGLALANTKRSNMIVRRIESLAELGKKDDEAMIFLENMWSDAKSNIESLLATAKALKPEIATSLPYDGDALLAQSMDESHKIRMRDPRYAREFVDKPS